MARSAALILLLWAAVAPAGTPRRFAVVVGANRGAPAPGAALTSPLRHAVRDARKMARVLVELGGVQEADLTLLVPSPTAADVLAAIDRADAIAAAAGGETAIVIYYSGHASEDALELTGTRLSMRTLRARLERSRATVRLAMLDACHSGGAIRTKGGKRTKARPRVALAGALGAEGYAILTSSTASEQSQESDELLGSFFTHYLVTGLRGAADADKDGHVTLGEAYRHAYASTLRETAAAGALAQHPSFDMALRGGQDVVLTALGDARATVRIAGSKESARWILFDPDQGFVVAELEERPGVETHVAVPVGRLEVYRRANGRVSRGNLDTRVARDLTLSAASLEEVPLAAYLKKGRQGASVTATAGMQAFLSERIRSEYLPVAPMFGVAVRYEDLGVTGLDIAIDFAFSSQKSHMTLAEGAYRARATQLELGLWLPYRFDFDSLFLSLGPRLAYLYVQRTPEVDGAEAGLETDSLSTVVAGAAAGVTWRITDLLSLGIDGRFATVRLPIEDEVTWELMVEAQAALAFHF